MTYPDKEYRGQQLKVLLTDGEFQLVDTTLIDKGFRGYQDTWIWHMCDEYERGMAKATATSVGLLSNKEIARQKCSYCKRKIPDGMIGQFKMMNWEHIDEIMEMEGKYENG